LSDINKAKKVASILSGHNWADITKKGTEFNRSIIVARFPVVMIEKMSGERSDSTQELQFP
jgi:hypothetical protein